ncbi:unnamed protein product [Candida parapsilosis]
MQLIQLSLAGLMAISGAQSLFIPKNQDEFELITTKTDVKSLFKKYPNGKYLMTSMIPMKRYLFMMLRR